MTDIEAARSHLPEGERNKPGSLNTKPADIWVDAVNFEERRRHEIPFLTGQLPLYRKPKVFDAALASGATSIGLKLSGFSVVSNEMDEDFRRVAQREAEKYGVRLDITSYDWRNTPGDYRERFDAVLCLGNSLTLLLEERDRIKSLANFRDMMKRRGKLIIDERNYAEHFLKGMGRFKHSGNVVYCGKDKVGICPVYASPDIAIIEYEHIDGRKIRFPVYPFKSGEMRSLLGEIGFRNIEAYGDYKRPFNPEEPEFITYVARK